MEFLVVVCHPNAKSFNHAICDSAARAIRSTGNEATIIDLYQEPFDPVLSEQEVRRRFSFDETVRRYSALVSRARGYLIIHPDWWGMPPALLKGWLDRVFRPGVAYDYEGPEFLPKRKIPLLADRRALVFCTTDAGPDSDEYARRAATLSALWTDSVFGYCGLRATDVRIFAGVHDSTLRQRRAWLSEVDGTCRTWVSIDDDARYTQRGDEP